MKKKNLFLLVTVLTTLTINAKDHNNKTFLMPRSAGSVALPMEVTTWENVVNRKNKKDNFGASFQVTGFYNDSQCGVKLGKYFGPCGTLADCPPQTQKDTTCPQKGCNGALFTLQRNRNNDTSRTGGSDERNTFSRAENIDLGYIIHKIGVTANETDKVVIGINPEHDTYGVRFDYYQDLDCIARGIFIRVNVPIVHVENDLNFAVCSGSDELRQQIKDYFSGQTLTLPGPTDDTAIVQEKLTRAKIGNKQETTGVADIDVALGYKFLEQDDYYASIAAAITIPTGDEADGIWLFEPIVGNGHHFGVGGDIDAMYRLWGDYEHGIKLLFKVKYRYLFESSQKRTLGLKTLRDGAPSCPLEDCPTNCDGTRVKSDRPWGQYTLLGCQGQKPLVPAANVTTVNVQVTPGSQFDGILGLNYTYKGFTFDVGYNLYYREAEDAIVMGRSTDNCRVSCTVDFENYAVAARGLDNSDSKFLFALNDASVDGGDTAGAKLTADQSATTGTIVTPRVAQTPSQLTHSLYGGLGYVIDAWSFPLLIGIGGKYEWKDNNAAIENWGVWGKIGFGF